MNDFEDGAKRREPEENGLLTLRWRVVKKQSSCKQVDRYLEIRPVILSAAKDLARRVARRAI